MLRNVGLILNVSIIMAFFFVKPQSRYTLRAYKKAIRKRSLHHHVSKRRLRRNYLDDVASCQGSNPIETIEAFTSSPERNIDTTSVATSDDPDSGPVFAEAPSHEPSLLMRTLHDSVHPFLMRRAGGMMATGAATTAVNRIAQFIEWAHRYLHDNNPPPSDMAASARCLFRWFMRAISKHPIVLEEYITYQTNIFQRCPSTIINHFDALQQCYNFLVHDGHLADGTQVNVRTTFYNRFPFFVKRCKRTLRTQLKRHKYVLTV